MLILEDGGGVFGVEALFKIPVRVFVDNVGRPNAVRQNSDGVHLVFYFIFCCCCFASRRLQRRTRYAAAKGQFLDACQNVGSSCDRNRLLKLSRFRYGAADSLRVCGAAHVVRFALSSARGLGHTLITLLACRVSAKSFANFGGNRVRQRPCSGRGRMGRT